MNAHNEALDKLATDAKADLGRRGNDWGAARAAISGVDVVARAIVRREAGRHPMIQVRFELGGKPMARAFVLAKLAAA